VGGGGWNSRELIRSPILVFILILILKSVKCVFEIRAIAMRCDGCDAMRCGLKDEELSLTKGPL